MGTFLVRADNMLTHSTILKGREFKVTWDSVSEKVTGITEVIKSSLGNECDFELPAKGEYLRIAQTCLNFYLDDLEDVWAKD